MINLCSPKLDQPLFPKTCFFSDEPYLRQCWRHSLVTPPSHLPLSSFLNFSCYFTLAALVLMQILIFCPDPHFSTEVLLAYKTEELIMHSYPTWCRWPDRVFTSHSSTRLRAVSMAPGLHLPPRQPFEFPSLCRGQIAPCYCCWVQSPRGPWPQFELLLLGLAIPPFVFLLLSHLSFSWS